MKRYDLTQDKFNELMDLYVEGGNICTALETLGIPRTAFYRSLTLDNNAAIYASVQKYRADIISEEIIDIADNDPNALVARNRIDARKWLASKYYPHKFGDRLDLNVNQTVDIRGALQNANARKERILQSLEIKSISPHRATDSESVALDAAQIQKLLS